jgi:ferredoxin-NADP reductase/DMSO/TMAO reductase YedYZ heme-binding membrane subunit
MLALIFLPLSLLVTPLRKVTGFTWLFHFRRMLGLFAFFYASCHFLLFFLLDQQMNLRSTFSEMIKRPYLFVGSAGLLLMVPLALTSFNVTIRKMGPKRWQALHRLAYLAAIAGVVHYYMQVKADIRMPVAFAIVLAILLGYRVVAWAIKPRDIEAASAAGRWTGELMVRRIVEETPDVRTFELGAIDGGPLPITHLPGQYLPLALMIDGKRVHRTYTIASSPTAKDRVELTIKREARGMASGYFHERLHVGDRITISKPGGAFTFDGNGSGKERGIVLLAGGVGITPLMSMMRYLTQSRWPGEIYLVYSNKSEVDIVFRRELDDLQERFPNVHITFTITRGGTSSWRGFTGRINRDLLEKVVPDLSAYPVYICGPSEMIASMRELLPQMGVPAERLFVESFGTPAAELDLESFAPVMVSFARSGRETRSAVGESLLETAERLGVPLDYECRSGICGKCRCRRLSGSVTMGVAEGLSAAERAEGMILMCQARATSDVVIDA